MAAMISAILNDARAPVSATFHYTSDDTQRLSLQNIMNLQKEKE